MMLKGIYINYVEKTHRKLKKKEKIHLKSIFDVSQSCLIKSASMIKTEIIFGT